MRRQYKPAHYKNILVNITKKKTHLLNQIIKIDAEIIELEKMMQQNIGDKVEFKIAKRNKKIKELIMTHIEITQDIMVLEKALFEKHLLSKYKKNGD